MFKNFKPLVVEVSNCLNGVSQIAPVNLGGQSHLNFNPKSVQMPPFRHGFGKQNEFT